VRRWIAAAGIVFTLAAVAAARPGALLGARFEAGEGVATLAGVASGSPAALGGLEAGDRVLAIGDEALANGRALLARLRRSYPGQAWRCRLERAGVARIATVTLGTWSAYWRTLEGVGRRPPLRVGDAILVAGHEVPIGAPVVTFRDPGGFDGYARRCAFTKQVLPRRPASGCNTPLRYGTRRGLAPEIMDAMQREGAMSLTGAQAAIDQVVIHYDVAWTSQNCFKVLHDLRGLSCQFLLDVDGTLYQTLDVVERARHAGAANSRSVGIEIAHPGPLELTRDLAKRYRPVEGGGVHFDLAWLRATPRTPGFLVRPARPAPIRARIQGRVYSQYDYTQAQYRTLGRLLAGLSRTLPKIRLDAPRDTTGAVRDAVLSRAEVSAFSGLLGHYHVSGRKQDPGPAFDWARVIREARALR
jgi:N-acetylmuramoyl-L-alanine amidase